MTKIHTVSEICGFCYGEWTAMKCNFKTQAHEKKIFITLTTNVLHLKKKKSNKLNKQTKSKATKKGFSGEQRKQMNLLINIK